MYPIGTRVRIKTCFLPFGPHQLIGTETVVVGHGLTMGWRPDLPGGKGLWDANMVAVEHPKGGRCGFTDEQLEPINPDQDAKEIKVDAEISA